MNQIYSPHSLNLPKRSFLGVRLRSVKKKKKTYCIMANVPHADDYELCLYAQDPVMGKHPCPLNTFHCSGVTLSISKHLAHNPHIWEMCEQCLSCSSDRGVKRDQIESECLSGAPSLYCSRCCLLKFSQYFYAVFL